MFSLYAIYTMKMNNDNNTIYGFDVNLICEFFLNTKRQGPGSPDVTLKALSFIDNLSDTAQIADIGCVEKPLNFDPFGHAELSLLAKI